MHSDLNASSEDDLPPWPWRFGQPEGAVIVERASEAAVGLYVLVKDENSRVYPRSNGRSFGSPIPRYYFRPHKIVGENRASWLLDGYRGNDGAFPKTRSERRPARFYGLKDAEDHFWLHEHRYALTRHIERLEDADLVKRVAEMVSYRPSGDRS